MRAFVRHHAVNHTTARIVNYELAALTAEHRAVIEAQRGAIQALVRDLVVPRRRGRRTSAPTTR